MAIQTKQTKATLLANLPDNATGDVSPQDVRDIVESLDISRGGLYWSAFATTTLTLQGTSGAGGTNYYKILGTTVARAAQRFTHASPNRLTYTGTPTINFDLFACLSFSVDTTGDIGLQVYKNGAAETASYQTVNATANVRTQAYLLHDGTLAANDYLEIWANHQTAAGAILTPAAGFLIVNENLIG